MSDYAFIMNADKALSNLIWNSIKLEPNFAEIISSKEQISFASPKVAEAQRTKELSVFLYSITEEGMAKNISATTGALEKRMPEALFTMHYLFTPCTGNEEKDHILLGKIIQIFTANPVIAGTDPENVTPFKVKLDSLSLDDLSKLWTALATPMRPSAIVTVELLTPENTSEMPTPKTSAKILLSTTENVTELYQKVLKTFTDQSDGWKKRNMLQKQWIFQDFKKVTETSVEEMTATLDALGDKLERHSSTSKFIKPLNALAGYYEHQREQLSGLQKFSRRQKENVEMITQWIKDVKDLIASLND